MLWISDLPQYLIIMRRIKIGALLACLLCFAGLMTAQNVNTPYSMYGYGIIGDRATSMQRQMGGTGYAMQSGRQINAMNPASYASIDSLTFLFDMGAGISFLWSSEKDAREHSIGGGLDYVTMQFPLSKYMGASVGLIPYSSVGYAFGNAISHGAMQNEGSGGINEAYIGVAGKFKGISLGVNISYDFGNIANDVFSTPATGGQTKFEHVMEIRDWNILVGAQYGFNIGKTEKMVIGLTYQPKKSFRGHSFATIQETVADSRPDTIGQLKLKGNYYQPTTIGAGISYSHERASRWMLAVDFTYQNWKDAKYSAMYSLDSPDEVIFSGMRFDNRYKVSIGGEYIPKLRGNYLKRVAYRIGGYYTLDYLNISGNQVRDYGITAGLGFPTIEGKTIINVGFEWKKRRAYPIAMLTENYFNITLGVNFNELWFWKRKIR